MTTKISSDNIQQATLEAIGGGPTITNIQITDSSYTVLDDTAVALAGGYIKITGTKFAAGATVIVNGTNASSVTVVSSTVIHAQVGAQSAGTYVVYVTNTDGSTAIRVNGLTYSSEPTWVTDSTLASQDVNSAFSIQLSATSATTYTLQAGSSLPPGVTLSSSGLLSGTVTDLSLETTYNFTIVATDAEYQDSPRSFSVTISIGDEYWRYVSMIISPSLSVLPFNDDASTNNFVVTINGDTKPNNFSPYTPGYYSNYFDGSGDYLTIPGNAAFNLNTGDWTIEYWFYHSADKLTTQISQGEYNWRIHQDGLSIAAVFQGTTAITATSVSLYQWHHLALVRSSTTTTLYIDGVSKGTTTSVPGNDSSSTIYIGRNPGSAAWDFNGYLSNIRIVKGTAVYTANFTPPATPLTAITNTSLLTCQSNRLIDNSTNNFAITKNGDVTVNSFEPFVPNSSHSTYGSVYFDGNGDYLNTISSSAFGFGTGDFTIEFWAYPTVNARQDWVDITNGSQRVLVYYDGTAIVFYSAPPTSGVITGPAMVLNSWQHIALTKQSGSTKLFVNGVQVGSIYTTNQDYGSTCSVTIGKDAVGSTYVTGYMSDVRIIKGTAVYTSNFTPPTSPLTAITNTSLLTCQTNQPANNNIFLDNSTNSFLITRAGNATQGTFSPYGENWSNYFDGNGDALSVASANILNFGTDNFTVEFWIYLTSSNTTAPGNILHGGSTGAFGLYLVSTGIQIARYNQGGDLTYNGTIQLNTWVHLAFSRQSGTGYIFINGTQVATGAVSTNYGASSFNLGASSALYYSNVRVVKGTALYTSNFTPSTTPLQPVAGTSLLTCKDSTCTDGSVNNFSVTRSGDVSVQKFGPFAGTTLPTPYYSAYFDGTGDYLLMPSSSNLAFGTNDFTVEFWLYPTSVTSTAQSVISNRTDAGADTVFTFAFSTSNGLYFHTQNTAVLNSGTAPTANVWQHVAYVRSSGTLKIYLNGVQVGSAAAAQNLNSTASVYIGHDGTKTTGATADYSGYISNLRVVNGTAVYTTSFTPPTAPLTAVANTQLLTCQSKTFVDNSTNNFTITANGNSKPTTFNPFTLSYSAKQSYTPSVYGGSMYLDGTGDFLSIPSTTTSFGTGDYTMEVWFYPTSLGAYNGIIDFRSGGPCIVVWSNGKVEVSGDNTNTYISTATGLVVPNRWTHIALTRNSGNITVWINGVSSATGTKTGSVSAVAGVIGKTFDGYHSYGYITDARIIKGQALYTSNFVPDNKPLTAVRNSTLLLNGTSASIYDSSEMNNFETLGDAKISTTILKYGNTSVYFDGNGDYLSIPYTTLLSQTGPYTVEGWFYPTNSAVTEQYLYARNAGGYFCVMFNGSVLKVDKHGVGIQITGSTTLATNTWNHWAMTYDGTTTRLFANGILQGSVSGTGGESSAVTTIGYYTANGSSSFYGYMSDFRFTKGIARYTATFTPPSSAFKTT